LYQLERILEALGRAVHPLKPVCGLTGFCDQFATLTAVNKGMALDTAGSQVRCLAAAPLDPGASTTFPVVVAIDPALGPRSVLTDDQQATAAQSDPAVVASARVTALVTRQVNLVVTKTTSRRTAAAGLLFSFTVRVVNEGPVRRERRGRL
jgi:hypothetical protein